MRFHGGRFDTNALSFDALPDLLVYRDLLVDLSRHLWLEDHKGRVRAPRRFDEAFPLFLRGVEPGSACAIIERDETDPDLAEYMDRAGDLVNVLVGAAGTDLCRHGTLPASAPAFPASLARHFNRFGRKLRSDEWVELQIREAAGPRYDASVRKRIALEYTGRYEEEIVLEGELGGVDLHRNRISIKTADGVIVDVPSCPAEVLESAVRLLRRLVQISVVAEFDRSGRRERVKEGRDIRAVNDEDSSDAAPLPEQFARLRRLPPGWLEPSTPALDSQGLGEFESFLESVVAAAECPLPFLYPTEDGGARAEWTLGPWEVALTADLTSGAVEFHATNVTADTQEQLSATVARPHDAERVALVLRRLASGGC